MKRGPVLFGRHLLLERVALGGMAEVYLAKMLGAAGFERFVAVKRILPELAEDASFVAMFVDEARIAAQLSHPNIVEIHELGRHEGNYFISMEFVSGRDLRQLLDRRARDGGAATLPVELACHVAARVADALDHAHRKRTPAGEPLGIIHRDVSPQNVLLSFDGEVKLCDFGIAKAASRAQRTEAGVLKGKFAYMSPEQVRQRAVDHRSDQFALGVILWETLAGARLFVRESDYATIEAVRLAEIPPWPPSNAPVAPELGAIVHRMLRLEPEARFSTLGEVRAALEPFALAPAVAVAALRDALDVAFPGAAARERAALDAYVEIRAEPEPPRDEPATSGSAPDGPLAEVERVREELVEELAEVLEKTSGAPRLEESASKQEGAPAATAPSPRRPPPPPPPDAPPSSATPIEVSAPSPAHLSAPRADALEPALAEPTSILPDEAPPTRTSLTSPVVGPPRPRRLRLVAAGLGALGMLAAIVLGAGLLGGSATLRIEAEPPVPIEVRIDGEKVPGGASRPIEGLRRGLHLVEVRAEGFRPYTQQIRIGEAGEHTMQVRLRAEDRP